MTINQIPTKQDKKTITDTIHQLSAEEFNIVVKSIINILGTQLTKEEYEALTTKDANKYYYIVEQSSGGNTGGGSSGDSTTGSVSSTILTLTNSSVSGEVLTVTNATISGSTLILN